MNNEILIAQVRNFLHGEDVDEERIKELLSSFRGALIIALDELVKENPKDLNLTTTMDVALISYGDILFEAGDYPEALKVYQTYFDRTGLAWQNLIKTRVRVSSDREEILHHIDDIIQKLTNKPYLEVTPLEAVQLIQEILRDIK